MYATCYLFFQVIHISMNSVFLNIVQMNDGTSIRPNEVISIAEMFEDRRYSMHNIPYRYRVCKFFCVFIYTCNFKHFFKTFIFNASININARPLKYYSVSNNFLYSTLKCYALNIFTHFI